MEHNIYEKIINKRANWNLNYFYQELFCNYQIFDQIVMYPIPLSFSLENL